MKTQPPYPHQPTCWIKNPSCNYFRNCIYTSKIGILRKSHFGGAYLHFILSPKEVKISLFAYISLKCYCLLNTTSRSPVIVSYWPLRVCKSINHISLTNSTAFCLNFWNTHLHLVFHYTQFTKEDIVALNLNPYVEIKNIQEYVKPVRKVRIRLTTLVALYGTCAKNGTL